MINFTEIFIGQNLPKREHTATNVSLFCYNAAIWNPHRIHYDERYTTEVEKHPGVVIDGPLQGDWLSQIVINWIGDDAKLINFNYSNRQASYLGETLKSGGKVTSIDTKTGRVEVELFLCNEEGEITSPGTALVEFAI
jgi:3-methylfumaryl-CoA hydratase